jgi:hypothetical protein
MSASGARTTAIRLASAESPTSVKMAGKARSRPQSGSDRTGPEPARTIQIVTGTSAKSIERNANSVSSGR